MDLIFGIIYNDHDSDLIGRDQVDDYTIDTCLTADQGYETAVWVADHNMALVASRLQLRPMVQLALAGKLIKIFRYLSERDASISNL